MSNIIKSFNLTNDTSKIYDYNIEDLEDKVQNSTESNDDDDVELEEDEVIEEECKIDFDELKKNAEDEGYNEGLNKAKVEIENIKKNLQNDYELKLAKVISDETEKIQIDKLEQLKVQEEKIFDFVIELSKKIVGDNIAVNKGILRNVIKLGLSKISDDLEIELSISLEDKEYIENNIDEINMLFEDNYKYKINYKSDLSAGSCLIQTTFGTIDCSVSTIESSIVNELTKIFRSGNIVNE